MPRIITPFPPARLDGIELRRHHRACNALRDAVLH